MSINGASMILAFHFGKCYGWAATLSHNRTTACLSGKKCIQQHRYHVLKMSIKGASTIVGLA